MSEAFTGAIGAGLQELAGGGDFGDVAGAVTQNVVFGALPLFAAFAGVQAAIDAIRTWTGNPPRVSVLGALLLNGEPGNELAAEKLVENAAVQVWHGHTTFKGHGTSVVQHPGHPEQAWRWIEDFADQLADLYKDGGPEAVIARLKKSATSAQYLDACKLLFSWARATKLPGYVTGTLGDLLVGKLYQESGVVVRAFKDPIPPGPEKTPVHDKGGQFSRIGVPKYGLYVEAIAQQQTPSEAPIAEVFPGAVAVGFEDGAPTVLHLVPGNFSAGGDATQGKVSSSEPGVPARKMTQNEQLALVAVAAGAVLLLALL